MLVHVKYDGQDDHTIIMLHGTGGNETDLKTLSVEIAPQANIIGIRGFVEENGMLRYFKRYPDGTFDLKDLAKNTKLLFEGILELLEYYKLDPAKTSLLGYSNGANIAINMFKEFETPFYKAILLHPSAIRMDVSLKKQDQLDAFLSFGKNDPFINEKDFETLSAQFQSHTKFIHNGGHQLTYEEVNSAKEFYNN